MATYLICHDLLAGFSQAPTGTAWFYAPGTTTPITIAGDDTGTSITNPVTLDSNGAATVYLSQLARMIVQDVDGVTIVDTTINEDSVATTANTSTAFTGATQEDVNDAALTAFGGQNFQYKPVAGTSYVGMTPQAWMNAMGRNVLAYGTVGATAVNDGVTPADSAIAAAIAAAQAAGSATVLLPAGTYLCNSPIAVTGTGVTIMGAGRGATTIKFNTTTGNGLVFTSANGSVIRDLRITTPVASSGTAVTAVTVSGFQLINVKIDGWDKCFNSNTNCEDVLIANNCNFRATNAVASARVIIATDLSGLTIVGGIFSGASTGYTMEFLASTNSVFVTSASVGDATTAIRFDAALSGSYFKFVGNSTSSTNLFSFGAATMPGKFYQAGNGFDGYTGGLLTGATFTPDLSKGYDITIDATTTGSAYTVAVPAVAPASGTRGFFWKLTFYCHAGGAITGWGVAAGYHLSAGPSTTDTHRTTYWLWYDPDAGVHREMGRADTT